MPAPVGLPRVLGAAAASAAGDDTTDRAQLHPRIVGGLAGAVYSPAVLRLREQRMEPPCVMRPEAWVDCAIAILTTLDACH